MNERKSWGSADTTRKEFVKGNENRDYSIYTRLMDAALVSKATSLFPHFGKVQGGMTIVDAGSGTGALAELTAKYFHGAHVYALDISHELMEQARDNHSLTNIVFGDAANKNFPDNSVDVKFFSTSGHEVESYGGRGRMTKAVEATFDELRPGGRVVIRDFAKPARKEPIYMQILTEDGTDNPAEATTDGYLDYNLLSTKALFHRFHEEFDGGNAFDYEQVTKDGQEYIKIEPEWAHEFYLRKDYTANWRQEIREKYSYWTKDDAERILTNTGYSDIEVIPDPNEYIVENRLKGKIALFEEDDNGQMKELPFPPTHMLVVGVKPGGLEEKEQAEIFPGLKVSDYTEYKQSIVTDVERQVVSIGEKSFPVTNPEEPIHGSKKTTYRLAGEPARVLKVARKDALNDHSVFKAMFQSIARESVLDDFNVPHARILEADAQGHPYRYYIQEAIPEGSECAADLISADGLRESDVKQMASYINAFELGKQWQLDTNPFNWYRVPQDDGTTKMTYVDGKVYRYDEKWEFKRVGLLQWLGPDYVLNAVDNSAVIPRAKDYESLQQRWEKDTDGHAHQWKKYLHPRVQP